MCQRNVIGCTPIIRMQTGCHTILLQALIWTLLYLRPPPERAELFLLRDAATPAAAPAPAKTAAPIISAVTPPLERGFCVSSAAGASVSAGVIVSAGESVSSGAPVSAGPFVASAAGVSVSAGASVSAGPSVPSAPGVFVIAGESVPAGASGVPAASVAPAVL